MIEHGAMSMTDVAYQNGFSSISYFITVFRHRYGIPPKKYAQQERDKREV
jgi:AraC-like DNA-binding protein